jgi:hypothetical protein
VSKQYSFESSCHPRIDDACEIALLGAEFRAIARWQRPNALHE